MSSGDLAGPSGKDVRSATLIGGETKDDKGGEGGVGGMGGMPARGWNFWESAPVNTVLLRKHRPTESESHH